MDRWEEQRQSIKIGVYAGGVASLMATMAALWGEKSIVSLSLWVLCAWIIFGFAGWFFGNIVRGILRRTGSFSHSPLHHDQGTGLKSRINMVLPEEHPEDSAIR